MEYENLPKICFECGKYGHTRDECTTNLGAETTATQPKAEEEPELQEEDRFDPWMHAPEP